MVNHHQPNPNDEVVKCVVIGDSGVGKTCLVCAWACNTHYDLKKLVKTHVATVWAIDHYQRDLEILERSWCEVDSVQVSLRLWDTFGYHDKDRRFAYRGADVIILCFSTVRPSSLRNVQSVWYPEIRQFCPTTPIILVGTQADLRYLYNDDNYLKMEKGLMYRHIHECDIVTPAMGHDMAKEIGAPFYESSVLTRFGVGDIFINCVRAALIERRKLKFWNTQLRRVQRPLMQPPMLIPVPALPSVHLPPSPPPSGTSSILHDQRERDLLFMAQGESLEAHMVVLAVTCKVFEDLFSSQELSEVLRHRRDSDASSFLMEMEERESMRTLSVTSDDRCLLDHEMTSSPISSSVLVRMSCNQNLEVNLSSAKQYPMTIRHNHPAFECVEVHQQKDPKRPHSPAALRTVITLHPDITAAAMKLILEFLYTGCVCRVAESGAFSEARRAAELFGLSELLVGLEHYMVGELFMVAQAKKRVRDVQQTKLRSLALSSDPYLADVVFEVDNGRVAAHRALLMSGCEVMNAMFSNSFLESSSNQISFPGINCDTFHTLIEYIYTSEATSLAGADCLALIETANRLCLPHLVSLAESYVVYELQTLDKNGTDSIEDAILMLQPAELHNAKQLAYFCEKFLGVHYREAIQRHGKLFRTLPKDKQEAIEKARWPPVWHLKEVERYERHAHDRLTSPEQRQQQDYNRCFPGCLCFSRKAGHRLRKPVELPI